MENNEYFRLALCRFGTEYRNVRLPENTSAEIGDLISVKDHPLGTVEWVLLTSSDSRHNRYW